jgi:hypothetical protein
VNGSFAAGPANTHGSLSRPITTDRSAFDRHQPFGLSLSKASDLRSGPFDKLRVNGLCVVALRQAQDERSVGSGPFDRLRVNGLFCSGV